MEQEKNNDTLVAEIHNEFDMASDLLLQEAKSYLQRDYIAEELSRIGFTSVKRVKDMELMNEYKRMSETVRYYQERYPIYKFITPIQVEAICKKYGLYFGDISNYIGEIPSINIAEILRFKINAEDAPPKHSGVYTSFSSNDHGYDRLFLSEGQWAEKNPVRRDRDEIVFQICAPKTEFDLTDSWGRNRFDIQDGYKIVLDPIVLQPVKGGYLVVSKWGKEAGDEIIVNPNDN